MEKTKRLIIEVDEELYKILERLEKNIKKITWEGIDKVSKKDLTRILARKVDDAKIV